MTTKMGRYRYWGDQKPDQSRPLLTVTRDAVPMARTTRDPGDGADPRHAGTLRIYGPIDNWGGWWGVSSKEVAAALDILGDVDQVVVRINSPGGASFEGRAIMNLLRAHPAECIAIVDGLAASAASYVAVGCDETVMAPGTMLMIHDTSSFLYGNAEELRKEADVLDSVSRSGSELYADVAGGTAEEWRERMQAETWYTAAEAVTVGLADRVGIVPDSGPAETAGDSPTTVEDDDLEDRARASYDLSLFEHAPQGAHTPPTASAGGSTTEGKEPAVAFSDEGTTTLRTRLGIAEDADEATILAALDEALEERAESTPQTTTPVVPEGMALVEQTVLDDLRAAGEQGRAARQQQLDDHRDRTLDAAIADGRIAPARREHFATAWAADAEGTEELLNALTPGLVPVTEQGHAGGVDSDESTYDDEALSAHAAAFGINKEDLQ